MAGINEETRADVYLSQACNLWREYGASAKVRHILMHSNLAPEEDSTLSITYGRKTFSSKDMAQSRRSLNLDLLVGKHMISDIKMEASGATSHVSTYENGRSKTKTKSKSKLLPFKSMSDLSTTNECKTVSASISGRSSII